MADELINIKIEPQGGFGLSIGGKLPDLFYKLLPARYRLRRDIDETIHKNIVEKIGANTDLTEGEKEFIEDILSDKAAKALRLNRVLAHSCEVLNDKGKLKLGPAPEDLGHSGVSEQDRDSVTKATSQDWINRFREDASLTDEDSIQQIYAHILAEESVKPGSFSIRTLTVLRSIDRETAEAFCKLKRLVLNHRAVPDCDDDATLLYESVGLTYIDMIILEDVGLVSPTKTTFSQTLPGTPGVIFSGQERFGYDMDIFMTAGGIFLRPVMVLTPAGFQLATIAESEYSETTMSLLIDWIKRNNPDFNPTLARLGKGGGTMDDDDPVWSTFEIN